MAIVVCSECNKEMSDSAPACPNCGKPNPKVTDSKRNVGFLLGIGIFFLPIIFAWLTLRKGHTTKAKAISFAWLAISIIAISMQDGTEIGNSPSKSIVPPKVQPEQVMHVDIRDLLNAYENNEIGADNSYKGKLIQVSGIVNSIKKDILNDHYVTLGTGKQFQIPQLQAYFDESMSSQLGQLNKGHKVTVVCRVKGLMMNVLAEDCSFR